MTLFPRLTAVSLLALAATTHPAAQDVVVDPGPLVAARQLHDAGKYREAIDAIGAEQAKRTLWARLLYLEAQSYERISERENAARLYRELGGLDGPSWQSIGQSALELLNKQPKAAITAATRAVSLDPAVPEAHYQLGLALSVSQDFARAASAFDTAAELDPQWAYARYYAGLAYSKVKRIDLMAARFEAFLKLAPDAPERPEVQSIMRTVRGR